MERRDNILVGLKSISGYFPVTTRTVYDLIRREGFPAFKVRRHWISSVREIDKWLNKRGKSGRFRK
jgi:hypothetical protein